jgi:hypothetical protein
MNRQEGIKSKSKIKIKSKSKIRRNPVIPEPGIF